MADAQYSSHASLKSFKMIPLTMPDIVPSLSFLKMNLLKSLNFIYLVAKNLDKNLLSRSNILATMGNAL